MVGVTKVRESDAVLDVDGVLVRPGYERPGEAEDESVILHWTPGLDLTDGGGGGGGVHTVVDPETPL